MKSRICLFEGTFEKYHTELGLTSTAGNYLQLAATAAKYLMDNSGYALYTAKGASSSFRTLFTSDAPVATESILSVAFSSSASIFSSANWWWTSSTYGPRWSMSGRDVVGIAQTGTGKTIAFLLPCLRQWKFTKEKHPQILILVPTRELVLQVEEEAKKLAAYMTRRSSISPAALCGVGGGVMTGGVGLAQPAAKQRMQTSSRRRKTERNLCMAGIQIALFMVQMYAILEYDDTAVILTFRQGMY